MKVAVTVWEDTVSTVCDFSNRLLLLDVTGDRVGKRSSIPFEDGKLLERVRQLEALGVDVLLCGAISGPLERMIRGAGVKVIPYLRGSIDDIVRAYLEGGLSDTRFILPGCGPPADRGRGRGHRRGGFGCWPAEDTETGSGRRDPAHRKGQNPEKRMINMKIAITASGEGLDSNVDRVFGRARYFLITDREGAAVEVLENRQNVNAAQGAGIQSARLIANRAVDLVLTGNVGPNAFRALEAVSIKVCQFGSEVMTARDALEAWKAGRAQEVAAPTAKGHGF
ncbi:MAG: hypothetical protein LLG97_21090 [Deltaproteobacteria bacterium]|nr:hypothetical protein [Deltaproteobacteria bacterium]